MPTNKQSKFKTLTPCHLAIMRSIEAHRHCAKGVLIYVIAIALLSLFLSFNLSKVQHIYVAGQVADYDVIADRFMVVEDTQATEARRRQVMLLQPAVYDFSMESYILFEQRLIGLMRELNGEPVKAGTVPASEQFSTYLTPDLAKEVLPQFGLAATQNFVLKELLPRLREGASEGLVGDIRASRISRSGVVIQNLDTGTEVLRPDVRVLPDVQTFLTEMSTLARNNQTLSYNAKRAINIILASTLPPTLTLNLDSTQKRAAAVAEKIEPVYYHVQKGEMLVRHGERVSREQQIKIQALNHNTAMPLNVEKAIGTFLVAMFISLGFFLSPSGKPGAIIHNKDLYLICAVAVLTTLGATGVRCLGMAVNSSSLADAFSIAFPVAGAVGFVAMVFAARRYVTLGLLLTLLTTLAMHLSMAFALFHLLSAMLSTWLVSNSVSRQDFVWNLFPIILGEMLLAVGVSFVEGIAFAELPMLLTAVAINAVLTLILFFSLSPVLETLFGYSTRFRLMECISLEQPLMQEIMVTIPGTYHHSLVVANMVEAGAKAIGANSLLCKVAALYHDAGKLMYPQYFVENQFGGPNKHDRLSPSMSALIIMSHVKKGVELCQRYKLGKEITDIVAQHHGTRTISFFYHKAVKLGENPRESDYSYPGPKPQSKEAAILMLADSVEASSRTLADPTPARLKAHIDKIIKGIFAEGQLDESELTFRDLHFLGESFQKVLTGIFHQRIAYPENKKGEQDKAAASTKPTTEIVTKIGSGASPVQAKVVWPTENKKDSSSIREAGDTIVLGQPIERGDASLLAKNSPKREQGEETKPKFCSNVIEQDPFVHPMQNLAVPRERDPDLPMPLGETLPEPVDLSYLFKDDKKQNKKNTMPDIEMPDFQKPQDRP